ncbi:MAG: hypothetical protein IKK43_03235 [Clostridia bacterium]|nr:hypothetical protein [Clostridia bacterium]
MGIKLTDLIENDDPQDSLVEDKSKKTMKLLTVGVAALLLVIVVVVVIILKNVIATKQMGRIKNIANDAANLSTLVATTGIKYRSNIDNVQLVGTSLENEEDAFHLDINGKREEYRYGYYYLTNQEVNEFMPTLTEKGEEYVVNYTTGEVINIAGVEWGGRKYHSNMDITALAKGEVPPSDSMVYINTPQDMELIRQNPNGYYKLSADIDMSMYSQGNGWKPIENFYGVFEGRGYKISNLVINRDSENYCGLFGQVYDTAILSEVVLENVNVNGGANTGALAGNCTGTISNCSVTGIVNSSGNSVGGLVGSYNSNQISNSYANVSVTGSKDVGGLVGTLYGGRMLASYSKGTVTGMNNVGGLIGAIKPSRETEVSETYADTRIKATENAGGLIGSIEILNNSIVNTVNSYAIGAIEAANNVAGGFVGNIYAANGPTIKFESVYTAADVSVDTNIRGGFVGKISLPDDLIISTGCLWEKDSYTDKDLKDIGQSNITKTFESKTPDEMLTQSAYATWDLTNVWNVGENTRAYFKWQTELTKKK